MKHHCGNTVGTLKKHCRNTIEALRYHFRNSVLYGNSKEEHFWNDDERQRISKNDCGTLTEHEGNTVGDRHGMDVT